MSDQIEINQNLVRLASIKQPLEHNVVSRSWIRCIPSDRKFIHKKALLRFNTKQQIRRIISFFLCQMPLKVSENNLCRRNASKFWNWACYIAHKFACCCKRKTVQYNFEQSKEYYEVLLYLKYACAHKILYIHIYRGIFVFVAICSSM